MPHAVGEQSERCCDELDRRQARSVIARPRSALSDVESRPGYPWRPTRGRLVLPDLRSAPVQVQSQAEPMLVATGTGRFACAGPVTLDRADTRREGTLRRPRASSSPPTGPTSLSESGRRAPRGTLPFVDQTRREPACHIHRTHTEPSGNRTLLTSAFTIRAVSIGPLLWRHSVRESWRQRAPKATGPLAGDGARSRSR